MRTLFARHNVRIHRFVLRLVGAETIAGDLVSEVFIDVWRNADRFEGHSQVSTWLLAIARFKALSSLRRRKDVELDDVEVATIPDTSDDPEITMQKKDRVAVLRECINHLSRDHREIIGLVYYHDKSVDEVAEIVGVPKNTVKTRMFYARKRMCERIKALEGKAVMWNTNCFIRHAGAVVVLGGSMLRTTTAQSQVLAMTSESYNASIFNPFVPASNVSVSTK